MRSLILGLGLALLLLACPCTMGPPPAPPKATPSDAGQTSDGPGACPLPVLPWNIGVFHVDTSFDGTQREHIRNAASAWNILSRGNAQIVVVEDLEYDRIESLALHEEDHKIIKGSSALQVIKDSDAEHPGYRVLGVTVIRGCQPYAIRNIYLATDRIPEDQLVWVTVHELGHSMGLEDLDRPGSIMSAHGRFPGEWFTAEDMAECKRVGVCLAR